MTYDVHITEIMKEIGWADGFHIPVANEENQSLEKEVHESTRFIFISTRSMSANTSLSYIYIYITFIIFLRLYRASGEVNCSCFSLNTSFQILFRLSVYPQGNRFGRSKRFSQFSEYVLHNSLF